MSSNVVTSISASTYNVLPNSFTYYISNTGNNNIVLPLYGNQSSSNPIVIINNGTSATNILDSNSVLLTSLNAGFSVTYVFNSLNNTWLEVLNTTSAVGVYDSISALVPILIADDQVNNNQNFGASGSSSTPTVSDYYYPFSTGGANFWCPITTGPEYLLITSSIPMTPTKFLLQLRGATTSNYFNQPIIQGSNDNITFTNLYQLTVAQSQSLSDSPIVQSFYNSTSFLYLRFYIPGTVGSLTNLGVTNLQYYGTF